MTSYELTKANIPWLLGQVKEVYTTKVIPLGGPDIFVKTAEVIVRERKWATSEKLFADHIVSVLEEPNVCYVPKVMKPGPAVILPLLDVRNRYTLARIWPMYKLLIRDEAVKYAFLGPRADTVGPNWLGMSHPTVDVYTWYVHRHLRLSPGDGRC